MSGEWLTTNLAMTLQANPRMKLPVLTIHISVTKGASRQQGSHGALAPLFKRDNRPQFFTAMMNSFQQNIYHQLLLTDSFQYLDNECVSRAADKPTETKSLWHEAGRGLVTWQGNVLGKVLAMGWTSCDL